MLEPCHLPMKVFEGLTWLEAAIKIATAVQKTKILEGGRDEIGVAFYNTASCIFKQLQLRTLDPDFTDILSLTDHRSLAQIH